MGVEVHGGIHLLDVAVLHCRNAVAQGHGLYLVVGDVEHRRAEAGLEAGDFGAHLEPGGSVKVAEGLIEQEQARAADQRAAQGNPLALAAGEGGGAAVEAIVEAEDAGDVMHPLAGLRPGEMPELEAEGEVAIDCQVRIEGEVLEDHRHVAVLWGEAVDELAADGDGAFGGLLQAGDQAQRGGLAAPGGAYENEEFLVLNGEGGVVHGANGLARRALEELREVLEDNLCHAGSVGGGGRKVEAEGGPNRVDGGRG